MKYLKMRRLVKLLWGHNIEKLNKAPNSAETKNTLEGEKRSVMVNRAKMSVPDIKPNCTAEVRFPRALLPN